MNPNRFFSDILFVVLAMVAYSNCSRVKRQNPSCTQPLNLGSRCEDSNPEVRYYFNPVKRFCLAFMYTGCEGNQNNYASRLDCTNACNPIDNSACSAGLEPYATSEDDLMMAEYCTSLNCPAGYQCTRGENYVYCCNATVEDYFYQGLSTEFCSLRHGDLRSKSIPLGNFRATITGDSCANLEGACTGEFKCVEQNPWFAKCCENRTTETPEEYRCANPCKWGTVEVTDENLCVECKTVDTKAEFNIKCPKIRKCPSHCSFQMEGICRHCTCQSDDDEYNVLYTFHHSITADHQSRNICIDVVAQKGQSEATLLLLETDAINIWVTFRRMPHDSRPYTKLIQRLEKKVEWLEIDSRIRLKTNERLLSQPSCQCGRKTANERSSSHSSRSKRIRIMEIDRGFQQIQKAIDKLSEVENRRLFYDGSLVKRRDHLTSVDYSCYKHRLEHVLPTVIRRNV